MDPEAQFLKERLATIVEGAKEAIRREVKRLREQGLPVYVLRDGKVVDDSKSFDSPGPMQSRR